MRSFSVTLICFYVLFALVASKTIYHGSRRFGGRGLPKAPDRVRTRPAPMEKVPKTKGMGGFTPSQVRKIIAKYRQVWQGTTSPPTHFSAPRETEETCIFVNDRPREGLQPGESRGDIHIYYGKDMVKFRQIRRELDGAGPPRVRQYVYNSAPNRVKQRYDAVKDRLLRTNDPTQPVVLKRNLNSVVDGLPPAEAIRHIDLMRALFEVAQGRAGHTISIHYGNGDSTVPPDKMIMAPIETSELKSKIKSLYRDFQQWVKPYFLAAGDALRKFRNGVADLRYLFHLLATGKGPETNAQGFRLEQRKLGTRATKRDVFSDITGQGSGSASDETNTTAEWSAQFEEYYYAFRSVQVTSTTTILPFLDTMTNGSNSSLLHNAAWSIWADLTGASEHVAGPFLNGMHCLDSLEDQYMQENNLTSQSPAYQDFLAVNAILIDYYQAAWNQSQEAMSKKDNLTDQLWTLARYMTTNETKVEPANFWNDHADTYNDRYFTTYDSSK